MLESLGLSVLNPVLLWGSLLVAVPVIIHLLNKRKFHIRDWAAMDFLLEADRRNRRRVRLEHLLLLLLRCLALLLLALLVARLLLKPAGALAGSLKAARIERIFLLDDSPSMGARLDNRTAFGAAKEGLAEFVRNIGRERPGDTLTLLTTSRPEEPLRHGQFMDEARGDDLARTIEGLELSDLAARFESALLALDALLTAKEGHPSRAVYVVSDFRRREWLQASLTPTLLPRGEGKEGLARMFEQLKTKADSVVLVDVGGAQAENLALTDLAPLDKMVVAGVPARFEATVRNYGQNDASDVEVAFTAADGATQRAALPLVAAGAHAALPFTFTFRETGFFPVTAELGPDALPADNTRCFTALVRAGVPILLVDGEPSSEYGETETFFLERALAPPGQMPSGNSVKVVTENQFEALPLDEFHVIFLCNLYRLKQDRVKTLKAWVSAGGGLVFFLGDQIDEAGYNDVLAAKEGPALFPLRLSGIQGDEQERAWVHLAPKSVNHPILKVFQGVQNPFLQRVKFFRWWQGRVPPEELSAGQSEILATFTDPDASPAIVEKRVGEGRVLVVATTADGEWSGWPADPSYVVTVLEMVRHMARPATGDGCFTVGMPLRRKLDTSRYQPEVKVVPPDAEKATTLRAVPAADGASMELEYPDTGRRGFYRLELQRHGGEPETMLFAANIDAAEGDLRRITNTELRAQLGAADVAIVNGFRALSQEGAGASYELWRAILVALLAVLCAEHALAWWFGRRRGS